jgi:hypothetical protein
MVNIQHLTLYRRSEDKTRPILANPWDSLNSTEEYEVERIVEEHKNKGKTIYRVLWKGFDAESDTWQMEQDLHNAPEILRKWKLQL